MRNGGCIAFFDLGDDTAALPSANTTAWVNHIALALASRDDLHAMKARLQAHGVDVVGVTDHDGFIESIYFFDPNGLRLELTVEVAAPSVVDGFARDAHSLLDRWTTRQQPAPAQQDRP
jgi:catechol-2,3-dioxygenase